MKNYEWAKKRYFKLKVQINLTKVMGGNQFTDILRRQSRKLEKEFKGLSREWIDASDADVDAVLSEPVPF